MVPHWLKLSLTHSLSRNEWALTAGKIPPVMDLVPQGRGKGRRGLCCVRTLVARDRSPAWTSCTCSVQLSSVTQSCLTLCDPWIIARQASLSITNSRSLLKLMPIKLVMPFSHLVLCHPLLLLPPIPPSIRVFSNESTFAWGGQSTVEPCKQQRPTVAGLISK